MCCVVGLTVCGRLVCRIAGCRLIGLAVFGDCGRVCGLVLDWWCGVEVCVGVHNVWSVVGFVVVCVSCFVGWVGGSPAFCGC